MMNVFDGITVGCCQAPCDGCACDPAERVLRAYASNRYTGRMTPVQRAWCVAQADWAGEGFYQREELEAMDDGDLAATVLEMWRLYCQSQGLL